MVEQESKCIFCNSSVNHIYHQYGNNFYFCQNCGDLTVMDRIDLYIGVRDFEKDKLKIASVLAELNFKQSNVRKWIVPQPIGEQPDYEGKIYLWNDLITMYPSNAMELFNRAFLNLTKIVKHPMERFSISSFRYSPTIFFCETAAMAEDLLYELCNKEFVKLANSDQTQFRISANGWEYANSLKINPLGGIPQVFVAMSFDPSLNSVYDNGIEPAIKTVGLTPRIMRGIVHNDDICATMLDEIQRSKMVIVDCTLGNQGAFFEGGYAKALGKPVIFTVRKGHEKDMHFDTNHYHHVIYENETELATKLVSHLRVAMIENQA